MGIPTSPAVVFLEKDNSAYPPNIDSSVVGIVGYASKGPTNVPTLITSQENLIKVFGNPSESLYGQALEGALEILETTNQIRFVRVAPTQGFTNSYTNVLMGACPAVEIAASSFGVTRNLYLHVTLTDNDGVKVMNEQVFTILSSTENAGIGQFSAISKVMGNTGDSISDMITVVNYGGPETTYIVGNYAGSGAKLTVSAFSLVNKAGALTCLKPVSITTGDSGAAVSSATAYGCTISNSSLKYKVQALYPGASYNLSSDINTGQTLGINVEVKSAGSFKSLVDVNNDGVSTETYKTSFLNDKYFIEDVINVGSDNPISEYIKGEIEFTSTFTPNRLSWFGDSISNMIGAEGDATAVVNIINNTGSTVTGCAPRFIKLVEGSYPLTGGSNGLMTASGVIGSAANKTGIYALDDDILNISLAVVPGIYDQSVQNALITLAETSQNFLAVVAPPFAMNTVEEATDWMNGKVSGYRTAAINSSWASVFWPHVQVFDVFSAKDRWYDPSIFAIRQMVFTDNVAETWFAPAGFRRGRLTKPTATEVVLNQGDRDVLYSNNINPIVNFAPEGITIFGQKTAQRAATSLDRINVRRLMIYLRKVLLQTGRIDLFEPNDAFTWEIVKDKADALLGDIQARRGITDFKVICDETVNTPIRVDRNELWCKILIKPTKTAEWIIFEVNLTNQSAKFSG